MWGELGKALVKFAVIEGIKVLLQPSQPSSAANSDNANTGYANSDFANTDYADVDYER
jgi:hypothetical protein